ncbi:hypothetical protein GCM10018777_56340 [Streptomyces albogriseolus]|uniref:hypothetical protein n=1 Tax=Streptomyces albogriseolus TaxID=1887 RepID=UPI0016792B36|nr:hypothetical protein [Streptomyces viridodiastaticus]GHG33054.1 hypothetical protein GCM10018777_56340 [Streptomyces viridodiastaticus]
MHPMPEPTPTAPAAGHTVNPLTESVIQAATRDAMRQITHYRDDTPVPAKGDTPPVPQPDSRRVPTWATGIAVASLGIGAGATGLGCAAWLLFKGLSSVSLPSLQTFALILLAPFAGAAILAVAVGAAIAKAKRANTTNIYQGAVTVTSKTEVSSTARGMFARNRNVLPR